VIWLNNLIAHLLPLVPKSLVEIFAKQYIAGDNLAPAIKIVKDLNASNISATLDYLGEDPKNRAECLVAVDIYKKAVDEIYAQNLNSGVSLKLSHMGLKIDKKFCVKNMHAVAEYASLKNVFIRIDMEDITLKKETIDIYLKLKETFNNVGIAMQAYLRCAIEDADSMILKGANIRLCKGAYYREDKKFVYKDMGIINSSYAYLLEKILSNKCFAAIATHDEALVFEAMKIIDKLGLSKQDYEFQMLYGVQEHLRDIIRDQGHPIRVYVPFGQEWLAYSVRRLKENPQLVSYVFANGLKRLAGFF
jgi:proline dehydrogenase